MKKVISWALVLLLTSAATLYIPIVSADEELITQTDHSGGCDYWVDCGVAQSFVAVDYQIDITKLYLYIEESPYNEGGGWGRAGISETLTMDHNQWLTYENRPFNEMNGWECFDDVYCEVIPGYSYFIIYEVYYTDEWLNSVIVKDSYTGEINPYPFGEIYYYIDTSSWEPSSDHSVDLAFKIWGNTEEPNNPPYTPDDPDPWDGETGVSRNTDLSWDGGDPNSGDTVTYKIYFGTSSNPPYYDTIGPYPASQTRITYDDLETLDYGTKYYWKIKAEDNHGSTNTGLIWDFTTTSEPVDPPEVQTNDATDIERTSAKLNGKILNDGGENCQIRFQIREVGGDWWYLSGWHGSYGTGETFSEQVDNLDSGKTYEFKAGAKNSEGTDWGTIKKFTTDFYFIHITDAHVGTTGGAERFEWVIENINKLNPSPKFVVISGDLTHFGGFDMLDWVRFFNIANELDMDYYVCVGNHDHLLFDWIVYPYTLTFESYSECPTGNVNLISMDSGGYEDWCEGWVWVWNPYPPPALLYIPIIDWIPEGTGLTSGQWNWLNSVIDDYPEYNKIIFMHHPFISDSYDTNYPNYGEGPWSNGCIVNFRNEFKNLCQNEGVKVILGGHIHSHPDEYIIEEIPRDLEKTSEDGYHSINENEGYWSSSEVSTPIYIITGACSEFLKYRKIEIVSDDVRIYVQRGFDGHPGLAEYEMDLIPWPWIGKSGDAGEAGGLSAAGRLHVYDSEGNHVGVMDDGRTIDSEIQDSYYENEPIENETEDGFINWSQGELINLMVNESECYRYEIEIFLNSTLNLTGNFIGEDNKGEFITFYKNISVFSGSLGKLYINNGLADYILYFDDDADGNIDREILPTQWIGNRPPKKPDKPSGPTSGKPKKWYKFTFTAIDPDYNDQLCYFIDWGDDFTTGWLGPYNSGEPIEAWHFWLERGTYKIKVKVKDISGIESEFSDELKIVIKFIPDQHAAEYSQEFNSSTNLQFIISHFLQKPFLIRETKNDAE